MKTKKFKQELQQLSIDELKEKLDGVRRELFGLRLNVATTHIKDYSQFRKLRIQVARILTVMRQKQTQKLLSDTAI